MASEKAQVVQSKVLYAEDDSKYKSRKPVRC